MSTSTVVKVIRAADTAVVEARLFAGIRAADLALIERSWLEARNDVFRRLLERDVPRANWPQSLHWDWERKAAILKRIEAEGVGISVENGWQGVMLTRTASYVSRVEPDRGKPLVYLDFIETAPWNWSILAIDQVGRFRGIGSVLVRTAIEQSFDEGFHGRIGLHSLPQAEGFYSDVLQLTAIGRDGAKQGLMYFELSRERAQQILEGA